VQNNKRAESNGSKDGSKQPNARTKWLVEHEPSYNVVPFKENSSFCFVVLWKRLNVME
jgi:hypothetical protein